jgi:5-methylcytosine-specific restriction endonuclease McrA
MSVLQRPVLVLNKSWRAVNVTTVERALVMLWNGHARVIEVDMQTFQAMTWSDWSKIDPLEGEKFIQSTSLRLKTPEVIVLSEYNDLPTTAVTFSRRNLFKRDHYVCQYCHKQPGTDELTIDHILPKSKGGATDWLNCCLACITCNKRKANRTPEEAGLKLLKKPTKPAWRPIYAARTERPKSWDMFQSDVYWNIELDQK